MSNIVTHQTGTGEPHSSNHGLAAAELAIKQVDNNYDNSSSGKLYYGENTADTDSTSSTVRAFGIGIKADSGTAQSGVPIGGNLYLKEGTNMTISQAVSGDVSTVTFTAASGSVSDGDKGDISVSNSGSTWTIDNDAVTAAKLADTAVSAGSYTAADITVDAQGRITSASSGSIATSEIAADAITSAKIADDAVDSEHIADDAVDSEHIAAGAIDDQHYASGTGMGSGFTLEDDDGTEVIITESNEMKFIGDGIDTNWTNTVTGSDANPFDMTFTLDINDLSAATIASGDFIAFSDEGSSGDPTKKESIDDVASLFAGDGLTASSAVLAVNVDDSSIETNSDALRIKASGVTNAMLAGSITDSKLSTISTAGKVDIAALEIDGASNSISALADADLFIADDGGGGSNKKVTAAVIADYVSSEVASALIVDSGGELHLGAPDNVDDIGTGSHDDDKFLIYDVSGTPAWKAITRTNLESAISSGGGGSGTVNSGSQYEVAVYGSAGTTLDGYSGLTWDTSTGDLTVSNIVNCAAGEVELNPDGLYLGTANYITYEGDGSNAYETLVKVLGPTADRTINFPDVSGNVVTTGDTATVTATMLAADSVDSSELVDGSIDTSHLSADCVTGAKIADDAISEEHLDPSIISSLTNTTITASDYVMFWDATDSQLKKVDGGELTSGTTYSAGTGLDLSSTTFSVDVSDFMTNGSNNRVLTATGTDAMNAEAQMTIDGDDIQIMNSTGASYTIGQGKRIMQPREIEYVGAQGNTTTVITTENTNLFITARADEMNSITHSIALPDPEGGDAPANGQVIKVHCAAFGGQRLGGINTTGTVTLIRTASVGGKINGDASYSVDVCAATGNSTAQYATFEAVYCDAWSTWIVGGFKTMGVSNSGFEAV